ncbi:hypothetical protein [Streptomyces otsuchiensis]|uniref:hypothetical protein n=1 Tax=Streptomyces otsuchiensis TaxID=2681388 RepID=UPI001300BADC|nr:hypothetical protein [Streptomyces otsuchiensis]
MGMKPGQLRYWQGRLAATATNADRGRALWDLARTIAESDPAKREARWADLVRLLRAWTEAQQQ